MGTTYELTVILFLTTISVNFDVNYRQFKYFFCLSRKNARCALATQNKKKVYNDRCQQVYNPFILAPHCDIQSSVLNKLQITNDCQLKVKAKGIIRRDYLRMSIFCCTFAA